MNIIVKNQDILYDKLKLNELGIITQKIVLKITDYESFINIQLCFPDILLNVPDPEITFNDDFESFQQVIF